MPLAQPTSGAAPGRTASFLAASRVACAGVATRMTAQGARSLEDGCGPRGGGQSNPGQLGVEPRRLRARASDPRRGPRARPHAPPQRRRSPAPFPTPRLRPRRRRLASLARIPHRLFLEGTHEAIRTPDASPLPAPSQNACFGLGMGDADPVYARSRCQDFDFDARDRPADCHLRACRAVRRLQAALGARSAKRPYAAAGRPCRPLAAGAGAGGACGRAGGCAGDSARFAARVDRWKAVAEPGAWKGLDAIAATDKSFTPQAFLSGARAAYDMVVHAFAAGDSATLRNLMAPEAFANFDAAIRARAAAGHTMTTTVVSIDDATIAAAQFDVPNAQISVRFVSKLVSVTRDMGGAVVDGSPAEVDRPHRPVDLRPRRPLARPELAAHGDPVGTPLTAAKPRLEPLRFRRCCGLPRRRPSARPSAASSGRRGRSSREERGARAARKPSDALIEAARAALASAPRTRRRRGASSRPGSGRSGSPRSPAS